MRCTAAFTLIELMVGIAVAAILITVGIPGFRDLILDNRMAAQINSLVADLSYARSEAVKRNSAVTVCKRNINGTACDDSRSWTDGWIVWAESTNTVLRIREALPAGTSIPFPQNRNRIVFNGHGFSPGSTATFVFCDSRGYMKARGLVLSNVGRVRTARDDDGDGIYEFSPGNEFDEQTCP